jgi:hypothetical protein
MDLHEKLMADIGTFETLAQNWDGRTAYIAARGPEPHYQVHIEIVETVFGCGPKFENHAAVTELFFCASVDSAHLGNVGSRCADRYFEGVLKLVAPKVVVCVGARVFRYFRNRYGGEGEKFPLQFGQLMEEVVRIPHPNAYISREKRQAEMSKAITHIRMSLARNKDQNMPAIEPG